MKNLKTFSTEKGIVTIYIDSKNRLIFELPTGFTGADLSKFKRVNETEINKLR